jgi:hypothetical protein
MTVGSSGEMLVPFYQTSQLYFPEGLTLTYTELYLV